MLDFSFLEKLTLGISQCLLGEKVRYDGQHQLSALCTGPLAACFNFVPVCPEMGIGMGAPRDPIALHLAADGKSLRAIGRYKPDLDVTEQLEGFARQKAAELGGIDGYVFMSRSPSCGVHGVKVYRQDGELAGQRTAGLYARELMRLQPLLPVEEEERLHDALIRENFLMRVYVFRRWRELQTEGLTAASLQEFHARHKYLLMAHRVEAYRHLGRLVAEAGARTLAAAADEYIRTLMATLETPASRGGHANVLQHLAGYLSKSLDAGSRQALQAQIETYRQGTLPLAAPLATLRQHFRQHPNRYIAGQVYLQPFPPALSGC